LLYATKLVIENFIKLIIFVTLATELDTKILVAKLVSIIESDQSFQRQISDQNFGDCLATNT